jgi:hypothetical protein
MPCLDPVFTIAAGRPAGFDEAGREGLHAVQDAKEVGLDHASPAGEVLERASAAADAGVVHQDRDVRVMIRHGRLEGLHAFVRRHIRWLGRRDDVRKLRAHFSARMSQRVLVVIRHPDV